MRTCEGEERAFWDKRQLVKKINLNSLYGAILNPGCRFFDHRIGQSTTLTGRAIAKHMSAKVNELLTGEYDHTGKCIVYGDTDSVYFSAWPVIKDDVESGKMEWGKEQCIQLYDQLGEAVNETFPSFMETAFHTTRKHGEIMAGAREVVALKGLFITKKRYAALVIDNEGQRLDVNGKLGKMKAMGLDLKRSDTPLVMQEFMSSLLMDVLTGSEVDHVVSRIKDFKYQFKDQPGWEKGTPKRVNNLTMYTAKEWHVDPKTKTETYRGKSTMPGHVRAAINWNRLKKMHGDNYSQSIIDGMKTIVCKLKPNPLGYTSVGYPTDESHLPQWFKDLPFDDSLMEATIVDKKIDNLLGVLEWDLAGKTQTENQFDDLFSFG
jgi:DNA polymerase elongation subunit (family B)